MEAVAMPMVRSIGALTIALIVLRGGNALAWNFDEHEAACRQAYEAACRRLANKGDKNRRELACDVDRSITFGQACAISGDLVATPDELSSAIGGVHATSDIHYYSLALYNAEHFQPQSVQFWLLHQSKAISKAKEAAEIRSEVDRIAQFEAAFYVAAFASHFLADSFAAGHMGFNRQASTAGAAKAYHDFWNEHGRWVRARDGAGGGRSWFARGDGHLKEDENRAHVVAALEDAIGAVLSAFVEGSESSASEDTLAAWRGIPFEMGPVPFWRTWYWFEVELPDGASMPGKEEDWQPIGLVRRPARYPLTLSAAYDIQYRPDRYTETDAVARIAWGPYIVPGLLQRIYLGLRLGYSHLDIATNDHSSIHHGLASGLDIDVPFLVSSNGLLRGALAGGLMLVGFDRRSIFVGPRLSAELGPVILSLGTAASSLVYDGANGWDMRRPAVGAMVSGGYIWPTYFGCHRLGIPRVEALGHGSQSGPLVAATHVRYGGLLGGAAAENREDSISSGIDLRAGTRGGLRGTLSLGYRHQFELHAIDVGQKTIARNGVETGLELSHAFWSTSHHDLVWTAGIDEYRWSRGSGLAGLRGEWWPGAGHWAVTIDAAGGLNVYAAGTAHHQWKLSRLTWRGGIGAGHTF